MYLFSTSSCESAYPSLKYYGVGWTMFGQLAEIQFERLVEERKSVKHVPKMCLLKKLVMVNNFCLCKEKKLHTICILTTKVLC